MVEESLMLPIDVSAKTVNSGMDKDVLTPVVLVDKFGMEPNVSVLLGETSMVLYVLNVSMAKSGMPKVRCVSVQQVMSGQASLARKPIIVQEIEFGIQNYNIVSAQTESIGMEEVVLFSQFVLVEEYGIWTLKTAIVRSGLNGILNHVWHVPMDSYGMNPQEDVCVLEELS